MKSKNSIHGVMGRLRAGDSTAAAEVHDRFAAQLIRLAARRVQQRYRAKFDPDDVVQSVFHSFFRRHAEGQFDFENWDSLWSLLASITVRKCSRRVQAFTTDKRNVARERTQENEPEQEDFVIHSATVEDAAILEETLQQLLNELTPEQQNVLILKLQNYSVEEISEKVGRTERSVYRVLTLVRSRLEEINNQLD